MARLPFRYIGRSEDWDSVHLDSIVNSSGVEPVTLGCGCSDTPNVTCRVFNPFTGLKESIVIEPRSIITEEELIDEFERLERVERFKATRKARELLGTSWVKGSLPSVSVEYKVKNCRPWSSSVEIIHPEILKVRNKGLRDIARERKRLKIEASNNLYRHVEVPKLPDNYTICGRRVGSYVKSPSSLKSYFRKLGREVISINSPSSLVPGDLCIITDKAANRAPNWVGRTVEVISGSLPNGDYSYYEVKDIKTGKTRRLASTYMDLLPGQVYRPEEVG